MYILTLGTFFDITVKKLLYIYSKELAAVVPTLYRNFTVSTML